MKNGTCLDDDWGVVITEQLEFVPEGGEAFTDYQDHPLQDKPHRYLLVDLSHGSGKPVASPLRQNVSARCSTDEVTIAGTNPVVRMLAKLNFAAAKQLKDTRFFKTEDEALRWLKE